MNHLTNVTTPSGLRQRLNGKTGKKDISDPLDLTQEVAREPRPTDPPHPARPRSAPWAFGSVAGFLLAGVSVVAVGVLLSYQPPTDPSKFFWGVPNANVSWCECKYERCRYISELWNTVSNITMLVMAIWGLWMHGSRAGGAGKLAFGCLIFTAVGSILFHCTSMLWAEILDEMPMFLLMLAAICEQRNTSLFTRGTYGWWLYWIILPGSFIVGCSSYFFNNFGIFHLTFFSYVVIATTNAFLYMLRHDTGREHHAWLGAALMLAGYSMWHVEQYACRNSQVILGHSVRGWVHYLHAIWHVFAGVAGYNMICYAIFAKRDAQRRELVSAQ